MMMWGKGKVEWPMAVDPKVPKVGKASIGMGSVAIGAAVEVHHVDGHCCWCFGLFLYFQRAVLVHGVGRVSGHCCHGRRKRESCDRGLQ